jgi:S-DNA-T family DNA segregation ATPase FtsK/SpoIIIE
VAQATLKKSKRRSEYRLNLGHGLRESALVVLVAVGVYLLMALVSFDRTDPGWSVSGSGVGEISNMGGSAGAFFADLFLFLFGYLAYLAPLMVAYSGWLLYREVNDKGQADFHILGIRWGGFMLTLIAGCGLSSLHFDQSFLPSDAGGVLGNLVATAFVLAFSYVGTTLLLLALFFAGITIFTSLSWLKVIDSTGKITVLCYEYLYRQIGILIDLYQARRANSASEIEVVRPLKKKLAEAKIKPRRTPRIEPTIGQAPVSDRVQREKQIPLFEGKSSAGLPPLSMLDPAQEQTTGYSDKALEALSRQVELKLLDFGIEAEVSDVHPGPIVTRFELLLAPGLKVSKVSALAKDLARALSVVSVRIVEVIPGKPSVGLEIPNEQREMISLSEILQSSEYDEAQSPLTLGLGKDISGHPIVVNLAAMPHLLVAGTTGSGKSVGVNAMLLSLLYKASPADVRMILIDPKMLELSVYEGIPHLLTPVVTDMKEASNALRWSVAEMERRYKLMSALGVRNVAGYNTKVEEAISNGEPILDPLFDPTDQLSENVTADELTKLPVIVIVVDEFADMMMVVGKKVEELIARLAQKARAAGIHLILATQRPSVDVITGLIKANIPTRIAFQVSSKVDSRTILDQMGAEQLLGHGDMLYLPPGTSIPERVHGAFVSDQEVHKVCDYLREKSEPNYLEEIIQDPSSGTDAIPGLEPLQSGDDDYDPLYDQAVAIVTETRKASISYVQRRLKVGYNRAARMIEEMEDSGVVSQVQSNGTREVLAPPAPN